MMDDNEREMNMERIPGGIGRANPIGTGYGAGYAGADYATGAHTYGTVGASKPKPSRVGRKTVAFIAVFALLACILSGVGGGFIAIKFIPDAGRAVSGDSYTINATSDIGTTEAVAKKVLNSVVGITSVYNQGRNIFGQSQESSGVGTGIIVHKDGYILTNSHVVMDGSSDKITVLLSDGTEVDAKLLWNDDTIDLAVIKVVADGLTPVELGDSDKIQIGAYVAAIGNPLGLDFNGSITQGVVSGLNRTITASSSTKTTRMEGLIQVDAAINSGNSGGPLLNSKGEVIGVNTAKASAEGMGFAIPINTAKPIVNKIIETGSFERVYMGVSAANAADIASQYPNLNLSVKEGAFISDVALGSPADVAGLEMKDVITAVDDKTIASSTDLIKILLNYSAGDTVRVTFVRGSAEQTAQITLASQTQVYGGSNPSGTEGESGSDGSNGSDGEGGSVGEGGSQSPQGPNSNPFGDLFPGWGD